jgi:alcohol dehydrogenase
MDYAKALAALLALRESKPDLRDLIEEPGPLTSHPLLPVIAVTTTAGTGSEVTPFATIWDHESKKKLSLASPALFPSIAIVDPELTYGSPPAVAIATGLDALNQAFESVWNKNRSPLTLGLAGSAIMLSLKALPTLVQNLDDVEARSQASQASLFAGLCISQTRTAICHSVSYPLTAHYQIPHGVACAFTMAEVVQLCCDRVPSLFDPIIAVTGHESVWELVMDVGNLLEKLEVAETVRSAIEGPRQLLELIDQMTTSGRSDNFIFSLDELELAGLLVRSYNRP